MGDVVKRANHLWPGLSECRLPRTYLEAMQHLAAKHGWKIEQNDDKYYLRSIPNTPLLPRNTAPNPGPTPSNHLAFFDTLGEVHEFLNGK